MSTFDTGRAEARSRANRRLRSLTIGTAILGVTTTGVLGWAAAITNDGSAATAPQATETALDTAADTSTTHTSQDTPAASSAPSVSGSSGAAHAATGGS